MHKTCVCVLTDGGGDDEAELGGDEHGVERRGVPGERGARRRRVALAHHAAVARRPVPQQHGAVLRARRDVAVRRDVALGARHARHHAVVTEDYLNYLGCNGITLLGYTVYNRGSGRSGLKDHETKKL